MASLEVTYGSSLLQLALWHQKVKRYEGRTVSSWVSGKEPETLPEKVQGSS